MSSGNRRIHRVGLDEMDATVGLPATMRARLLDLDGVLTDTAELHAAAWKEMFDGYLTVRAQQTGTAFAAFDEVADYDTFVDGMSRADGTRSFLRSRGIDLPAGGPDDAAGSLTITGLGQARNAMVLRRIRRDGVTPYPGSIRNVRAVREAGLAVGFVGEGHRVGQGENLGAQRFGRILTDLAHLLHHGGRA